MRRRKTKIIATLGPSSSSVEDIMSLIDAGMDIARINLSHGDRKGHSDLIHNIKQARKSKNSSTAILLDTRGPEIRVVEMKEAIMLIEGRNLVVNGNEKKCSKKKIGVNYPGIAGDVQPGDRMLLDDGKIILKVEEVDGEDIHCRVAVGGLLTSKKRVSLPNTQVDLPSVSKEDEADIRFGIDEGVDFIAASFIRRAKDVKAVRKIIREHNGNQHIIAKIENRQGVDNVEKILVHSDGLMVARGDLGVELPAEEVPVIQKKIIVYANNAGKPVITATQMLESMIVSPSPTRAEASDVTNAVMDGSDAVMLSGETAMGKFPVKAVNFLKRCTEIAEAAIDYDSLLSKGLRQYRQIIPDAIAYASCAIAADLKAAAILSVTASGSTARKVAMYRPQSMIIALSPDKQCVRQLSLIRGVLPVHCKSGKTMDEQIRNGVQAALEAGLIQKKDTVAITAGYPFHTTGTTNMLRVHNIGEEKCVG